MDGYVYIQKTIPFEAGGRFTIAVINRPGGLDLLRITDNCCFTSLQAAHFRVGNLAETAARRRASADGRCSLFRRAV